jgi:alanine racemase
MPTGHGASEVSRVLWAEGARWFAVSSVEEGVALRQSALPEGDILVMGGYLPYEGDAVVDYSLTPALHSLAQMREFEELARRRSAPLRFHLKIDSGMGRLGTRASAGEVLAALGQMRHAHLDGLMTHLASAADFTSPQTAQQLAYFHGLRARLAEAGVRPRFIHDSSTNPIAYGVDQQTNFVRPGHALYGYVSPARGTAPVQRLRVAPALTWKAKLLEVKDVPAGTCIGYGATFRAPSAMRVGVVGAGYADGIFHRLSNKGQMIAAGRLVPIIGTISMDLTTIDLTMAPGLGPGDDVTLLGSDGSASLDAQQIARVAGTISYNILCSISARVHRVYL